MVRYVQQGLGPTPQHLLPSRSLIIVRCLAQAAADAYGELEDLRDALAAAQAAKAAGRQLAREGAQQLAEHQEVAANLRQRLSTAEVCTFRYKCASLRD